MPKSKRNQVVNLTKTKTKGREGKATLIDTIREAVEQYPRLFVFRYRNLRNNALKKLRQEMTSSSRFFLGSNKVMQVALGRDETTEFRPQLQALGVRLAGFAGLLCTELSAEDVEELFGLHEEEDFARPGQVATQTVTMPMGPVTMPETGAPLAHTLEPLLRKHGMPTKLNHGVVELIAPFTVCTEGKSLNPKQCALLRTFDLKMASFTLVLDSVWENGAVTVLSEPSEDEQMDEEPADDYGLDASMMLPPGL